MDHRDENTISRYSGAIALSGGEDPVTEHALMLLLRGCGYNVRVVSASSLSEPRVLEDVRVFLLTLTRTRSPSQRNALLTVLRDTVRVAGIPVLELATSARRTREEARDEGWHMVPWPCRLNELEQWIEAVSLEKSPRGRT